MLKYISITVIFPSNDFLYLFLGGGRIEAQEARNYLITKICDDIIEIIRVLQLKVDDEYDLDDPTNLMRKAQHRLREKMKMAKDWLGDPNAEANGFGMLL